MPDTIDSQVWLPQFPLAKWHFSNRLTAVADAHTGVVPKIVESRMKTCFPDSKEQGSGTSNHCPLILIPLRLNVSLLFLFDLHLKLSHAKL